MIKSCAILSTFAMKKNINLHYAGHMSSIHLNVFIEPQLDAGYTKMDKTFLCSYAAWSLGEDIVMKTNTCGTMSWVLHWR